MYKYLELVNEKNKFLNHIIKKYCENPREQKRKFILAYMKKCSVFRYWPFLVTTEIKGKHYYHFETYIDSDIYNSTVNESGVIEELTVDEAVTFIEEENKYYDYKIDYIQIDTPDKYSFIFTVDEYKENTCYINVVGIEKETWINENNDNLDDKYKAIDYYLSSDLEKNAIKNSKDNYDYVIEEDDKGRIDLDFKPKELVVLASRPANCKTQLIINSLLSYKDLNNNDILYITLDESLNTIANRILAVETKFPYLLVTKKTFSKKLYKRVEEALKKLDNIEVINCSTYNIKEIERVIKDAVPMPKLVIIDGYELTHYKDSYPKNNEEVIKMAKKLKALAKQLNITIVVTYKIDRSVDKRKDNRPKLKDVKGLDEVADRVYVLYRENYYKEVWDENLIETIEINEVKGKKKIMAKFDKRTGKIV